MRNHREMKEKLQDLSTTQIQADFSTTLLSHELHGLTNLPYDLPALRIVAKTDKFFDTDKSEILQSAIPSWRMIAEALKSSTTGSVLYVAGHTDSTGNDVPLAL